MNVEALIAETLRQALNENLASLFARLDRLQAPAPARLSYSIKEAAAVTGASENHLRTAIKQGELQAKQAGTGVTGRYIIPADCLVAWLHDFPQPALKKAQ